jgi:Eco57I restriction-modification methylase
LFVSRAWLSKKFDKSISKTAQETLKEAYKTKRISDYFVTAVKDDIRTKVIKGTVVLSNRQNSKPILLNTADVVMMNPPFTRQERIPYDYKKLLLRRFSDYKKSLALLGLYGYFILLADKFLDKNGKMALVLPATILRLKSTKRIRQLLVDNYHIQYIITTSQRSAFSESAQFREILLVAVKLTDVKEVHSDNSSPDLRTAIVELKGLPTNVEESKALANKIENLYRNSNSMFEDDILFFKIFNQQMIRSQIDNLYRLVSAAEDLSKIWDWIVLNTSAEMLTSLNKGFNSQVVENIKRFDYKPPFDGTFIHYNELRAKKKKDIWIIKETTDKRITSYNRFVNSLIITIPSKAAEYGFRRTAGVGVLDLTNSLDFIVADDFPDFEKMFSDKSKSKRMLGNIQKWRGYIIQRLTNVVIARRFDISAPGTRLLAYYSDQQFVGVDMWHLQNLKDDDAKIFCIWFNSTPNLLQIFIDRTETRGAWMKVHEYQIANQLVMNVHRLTVADKKLLLLLFEEIKDKEFPSIMEQLSKVNPLRKEIDKVVLKILGFSDTKIQKLIDQLYPILADEIQKLKTLMEG